ncbi:hypothetical protein [Natrinema hispanicum]|uniref:Uncharacterized protein n=1 Tax=Natrinema hispanicum TaxID=392421 RepID=A0A1I0G897_9EURY|nr:hypothetical protein [Natrinema hispanicum]SDD37409.1 hypothetical protein SAMN05192552_102036 [Natrinema hispanicum]SET66132.1 hypothetical protein SAMN04488694_1104 [Natrinema hispanicum]
MVTPNARRNRGQVILIGAITLAFILLGIVVVFNGVLYTETLSSSATSQSTADAEVIEQGLEDDLIEIARRGNQNDDWKSSNDFEDEITNTGKFNHQYRNLTANGRSAFMSLTDVTAEYGHIATNVPIDGSPEQIDVDDSKIDYLVLDLNATNHEKVNVTTDKDSTNVTIESNSNSFEIDGCEIDSADVRFDLVNGETDDPSAVDCDSDELQNKLSLIDEGVSYDEVEITEDNLGTYDIVARDGFDGNPDSSHEGVWKIEGNITYQSDKVSYERSISTILIDGDGE